MVRKILLLVGLLLSVIFATAACQPVQSVSAMKAQADEAARAENKAVVERFYEEVVNGKDFSVFEEVFDANVVNHELGYGPELVDVDILTAFPDLHLVVEKWVIEGDTLTAVVAISGTQQLEIMGVAPTGSPVEWSQIDIWHVENGKITEVWHNSPNADILQQIGYKLVPPGE